MPAADMLTRQARAGGRMKSGRFDDQLSGSANEVLTPVRGVEVAKAAALWNDRMAVMRLAQDRNSTREKHDLTLYVLDAAIASLLLRDQKVGPLLAVLLCGEAWRS